MRARSTTSSETWEYKLGRLSSDVAHLRDGLTEIREERRKDKAELDRVKHWLERGFFLALLLLSGLSGHAVAPAIGTWIGTALRALGGLRAG